MPPPYTFGKNTPEQVLDGCGEVAAALMSRNVNGPSVPVPATFSSTLFELGCFRSIALGPPFPENDSRAYLDGWPFLPGAFKKYTRNVAGFGRRLPTVPVEEESKPLPKTGDTNEIRRNFGGDAQRKSQIC